MLPRRARAVARTPSLLVRAGQAVLLGLFGTREEGPGQ